MKKWDSLISRITAHIYFVTVAWLLWGYAAVAQDTTSSLIRSGCEVDYPPFCIVHEDGRADGFAVELLREALAKMGREVTFRTGPWSEVRGWLERGEIDALPLVGRTPEREKLFDFTVPYLTMHGALVVRKETLDVNTLADLRELPAVRVPGRERTSGGLQRGSDPRGGRCYGARYPYSSRGVDDDNAGARKRRDRCGYGHVVF